MSAATLVCPVRACGKPLAPFAGERRFACKSRHSFDVSREGYLNLLQPQDRRSRRPGDSREAILARRRLAEAGLEPPVAAELLRVLDAVFSLGGVPAVLDVGCGDGGLLAELAAARPIEMCGVDISVPAIEMAARREPGATWVVANADRRLPWADDSFDLVVSVTARRNGPEFARVLRRGGVAVVVIPGEDDLIELREALLGSAVRKDRSASVVRELVPDLELRSRTTIRSSALLDPPALRDLLAATYRGARSRESARAATLPSMTVTSSRDVLIFRRGLRGGPVP